MIGSIASSTGATASVETISADAAAMRADWALISDVRSGITAVREKGEAYLPKFEEETPEDYRGRLATTLWLPEFNDALEALASRPFGRDIQINEDASDLAKAVYEDADLRGNNLTVFARDVFNSAIADGWCAVLVDYPDMREAVTIADDQAAGARPYLVQIHAQDVLALYTSFQNGKERVDHIRIRETETIRAGYGEVRIDRVRVLEPGRFEVWESRNGSGAAKSSKMELVSQGRIARGADTEIPIAFCRLGKMRGNIAVKPPLIDLAHMQIGLYRALSRKEEVMTYSAAPMLKVIGANAEGLRTGPRRALIVPPGEGTQDIDYIQPNAANIREIREDIQDHIDAMRRLGMQPMVQKANVSAKGTATDESKAHSVLQAWANCLKDCLEQAFVFVGQYNRDNVPVSLSVHTDFSAGDNRSAELATLDKARKERDLSRKSYREELQRRGVLGPQYDPELDDEALAMEAETFEGEAEIDPATGDQVTAAPTESNAAPIDATDAENVVSILRGINKALVS